MDPITKLIFSSIDTDISEHFSSMEDGSYMTLLPLYIHIGRHLAKISSVLTESHKHSCGCPDTCCKKVAAFSDTADNKQCEFSHSKYREHHLWSI